jgi:hypothetical protein
MKKKVHYVPVLVIAGIGMFLVWYSTQWGAGLISDTFQYISSARNLVAGRGFSIPYGDMQLEPMTKYPPLLPIVLAGFELVGINALPGIRLLNTFLFGVNIYLVFLSVQRIVSSYYFSIFASLLVAVSFVLIEAHSWALSEPLYIFLGLSSILLFDKYSEERKLGWLVALSILVSFAFLTRYVGLAMVVAVGVLIMIGKYPLRKKSTDAILFGSISVIPILVWTLRSYFLTETWNDRLVGFYPLTTKNIVSAIDVVLMWFLPTAWVEGNEKFILIGVALLCMIVAIWWKVNPSLSVFYDDAVPKNVRQIALHIVYIFFYGLVVVSSKTWVDPDIGLSDRILSPILVSLIVIFTVLLSILWNINNGTKVLVGVVLLGLLIYYLVGSFILVQRFHDGGIGIARRGWNRSDVVQELRSFSAYSLYSNSNSSLYLWSDRASYGIAEFEKLKDGGSDQEVILVVFHHVPPKGDRLKKLVDGLTLLSGDQIVSIYSLSPTR